MTDFIAVLALKDIGAPTLQDLKDHVHSHFDCEPYSIPSGFTPATSSTPEDPMHPNHPPLVRMTKGETIFFNCGYIRGICAPREAILVRPLSIIEFEILPYDQPPALFPGVDRFIWMPTYQRMMINGALEDRGRDEQRQSFSGDAMLLEQHRNRLSRWSARAMAYVWVRSGAKYTASAGGLVEIQPCSEAFRSSEGRVGSA